jgi:hypothetical protein
MERIVSVSNSLDDFRLIAEQKLWNVFLLMTGRQYIQRGVMTYFTDYPALQSGFQKYGQSEVAALWNSAM